MIRNYIKIATRNLLKNKGYTAINIIGLTIGLICSLLIALYIQDELSYDQYHANANKIYRVIHGFSDIEHKDTAAQQNRANYKFEVWGNAAVGNALKEEFPEIQEVVQFSGRTNILLKRGDKAFQEENVFFADSGTFRMFSWPLNAGDPNTALKAPYSCVLTESTAKKYFGDENPIGKTLVGGNTGGRANEGTYTVTAVMKDIPSNSHFTFDLLMSMSSFRQSWAEVFDSWDYVDFYTYFLVKPNFKPEELTTKIPDFLHHYQAFDNGRYTIDFESLNDVYLHSNAERQPGALGNVSNIYIFALIGLFILTIACVNFMNLSTARSMDRAKEVGIRKVSGADRKGLMGQFFGESLIIVIISAVLAYILVIALFPFMHNFTGKYFQIQQLLEWHTLLLYLLVIIITALLAGGYPAIFLSGFKPMTILRGTFRTSADGVGLRKGLVVMQFSLSIALIAGTIIVFSQMNHIQNTDMGFQKEQMLVIDYNHDQTVGDKLNAIKSAFMELPEVLSVAASRSVPGSFFPDANTHIETPDGEMKLLIQSLFEIDVDFIPHYDIEMAAGRAYSRDFPADTANSLIVNETAAKAYGYSNPSEIVGKRFSQWGREGQVIGVVKDFNYLSLHQKVEPLTLRYEPRSSRFISLQIQQGNMPVTMSKIKKLWTSLVPQRPFLYNFLEDSFNRQYEADLRFKAIFSAFSGLAIFVACLGLLGLATYTTQQRSKEIGVRKVLGASVNNLIRMLSFDFIKLVIVAGVIATPVAWWAINLWLENFAYHVDIHWWIFVVACGIAVVIALTIICFQTIRVSLANPVDSLRDE